MGNSLQQAEELGKQIKELSTLPDRFNDHFSARGWVIYESMKLDVIKQAVSLADAGNIDEAEQILVDYYSPKTVRFWLQMMWQIKAFHPRMRLAKLALKDYEEDRYHASIPVVLALMDGLVNELNGGRGFFADDTELEAWDSIAAHKKGLVELGGIFKKGRNKTRTEEITIPYRNGILHGNDLRYDNRMVAAKTWAALFAVREWAIKAEKGKLTEPPPKPKTTFSETIARLIQNQENKRLLKQWQPRSLLVGKDLPATGELENYAIGSPEQKLVEFLTLWRKKNYGHMVACVPNERKISASAMPKTIRDIYGDTDLVGFEIIEIVDRAAAVTEIRTNLKYRRNGHEMEKEHLFRLLYLDENGRGEIRDKSGYNWYVDNWRTFY
jgi:hypothetical protein